MIFVLISAAAARAPEKRDFLYPRRSAGICPQAGMRMHACMHACNREFLHRTSARAPTKWRFSKARAPIGNFDFSKRRANEIFVSPYYSSRARVMGRNLQSAGEVALARARINIIGSGSACLGGEISRLKVSRGKWKLGFWEFAGSARWEILLLGFLWWKCFRGICMPSCGVEAVSITSLLAKYRRFLRWWKFFSHWWKIMRW